MPEIKFPIYTTLARPGQQNSRPGDAYNFISDIEEESKIDSYAIGPSKMAAWPHQPRPSVTSAEVIRTR